MNRRLFLQYAVTVLKLSGLVALTSRPAFAQQVCGEANLNDSGYSTTEVESLKDLAQRKGIIFGAAQNIMRFDRDPAYAAIFSRQCALWVPEGQFNWKFTHPAPGLYDFSTTDRIRIFAQTHNLLLKGQSLIYHGSLPQWVRTHAKSLPDAEKLLKEHINRVAGHYKGAIYIWNVINELFHPPDGRKDGLRTTLWLRRIGPEYIDIALNTAAEADPKALLSINVNHCYYDLPEDNKKRVAILNLLDRIKKRNLPLHVIGIQAHLNSNQHKHFNAVVFRTFLQDIASRGFKIHITELDVSDQELPSDAAIRDKTIAGIYKEFLSVTLDEQAVNTIMTWGLSDKYTYMAKLKPRKDKLPVRPLLLDNNLCMKPAWNAVAEALKSAPNRT